MSDPGKGSDDATARIGVWQGEGIGPEIVAAARAAAEAACAVAGARVEWVEVTMGAAALEQQGVLVPESSLETLDGCDGCLVGPHDSAAYPQPWNTMLNPSGELRRRFGLFANVRPSRTMPGSGVVGPACHIDVVVVRENTEGFYADRNMFLGSGEVMPVADVALATGVFTRVAVERVARVACTLARDRSGRLAIGHKANVLPVTMGLFRDVCLEVAGAFRELEVSEYYLDALAAALVRTPAQFDVIVTENMFGDVLSSVAAELAGSLGAAGSLNVGETHAMAQASHGSAPDLAGRDVANPIGMVSSLAMLFDWLGRTRGQEQFSSAGSLLAGALDGAVASGLRTRDMGGGAGTREFTERVIELVSSEPGNRP